LYKKQKQIKKATILKESRMHYKCKGEIRNKPTQIRNIIRANMICLCNSTNNQNKNLILKNDEHTGKIVWYTNKWITS